MDLVDFRSNLTHFGVRATLLDVGHRAVNKVISVRVLKGVKIERVNSEYLNLNPSYQAAFLPPELIQEMATLPVNGMSLAFVKEALEKGDRCFGILDGNRLASYGWYSANPTRIDLPGLALRFDQHYVYMYKGFTNNDYRGKRLHAIGMTMALREFLTLGYRGLVSYVEATNYASLKSVYRMGYEDFGKVTVVRLRNRYFLHSDRGCRALNFALEPLSPLSGSKTAASQVSSQARIPPRTAAQSGRRSQDPARSRPNDASADGTKRAGTPGIR